MSAAGAAGGGRGGGPGAVGVPAESSMFKQLNENVKTATLTLGNTLQEFLQFKDELLQHQLPSNLLLNLSIMSSRLFRSYSDLCTPLGELCRLTLLHSSPWEKKAEDLKKIRSDYESMQRKLNIAVKKLEVMSVEASRMQREKVVGNWERLFCYVTQARSHGRRWKFRIEPLRKKLEAGHNPYQSDSDSDSDLSSREEPDHGSSEESDEILKAIEKPSPVKTLFDHDDSSRKTTPIPPPPPVETAEAATATSDPSYDNYLLVQLSRPINILPKTNICCSVSLGQEFHTSEVFPGKPAPDAPVIPQAFHFLLSENETDSSERLLIGVYPRNISDEMAASLSLPLADIQTTGEPTVIVPPVFRGEEFQLNWDEINAAVTGLPIKCPLTRRGQGEGEGEEEEEEEEVPLLPLICHRVKVQRHQHMESCSVTMPLEELMSEMGYRQLAETQSRAASALPFDPAPSSPPTPEQLGPTESEVRAEVEKESEGRLETLTLQHMKDLEQLQHQYEEKLNSLSRTLAKVKVEKNREIQDLEQTMAEMEKQSKGRKGRSVADIQRSLARKRKAVSRGLPDWGKDFPDDFFERLELFKEESIRKQEELIDRIRKEVSEACEKQLATQHKLAPATSRPINVTEDVTLPALFMPTAITKHLVYTPRAHQYFHPPGSHDTRLTQPPAVFKLPALHSGLQTLNLFELSKHFSQTGPEWLKESGRHSSPRLTPAPPPSACGYYNNTNAKATIVVGGGGSGQRAESAVYSEDEDEDSEMDYGGLGGGTAGKVGERVHYVKRRVSNRTK